MVARQTPNVVGVLFLIIFLSLAWANDTTEWSERGLESGHTWQTETNSDARTIQASALELTVDDPTRNDDLHDDESKQQLKIKQALTPQDDSPDQLRRRRTPTEEEVARVTTPPLDPLVRRQDQSQIDQLNARIQSLQQSAQSALQSLSDASRQVSQASQQLSQSSQQLSQQSQQLSQQSQSLSQASQQLSQDLQQATQSIDQLTRAVASESSAFASCTASAAAALAQAANDASTRVDGALAQATLARNEADEDVQQAQASAVSITQAAAAIIGTFVGSSLLTVIVVIIFLRLRRKKRRDREAAEMYNRRPSYNSMEAPLVTRDVKVVGPETPTPRASAALSRFTSKTTVVGGSEPEKQQEPLPKLGIKRKPTGGSSSSNNGYATRLTGDRAPVRLAEPPPARKKAQQPRAAYNGIGGSSSSAKQSNGFNSDEGDGSGSSASLRVFPKTDPDPRGLAYLKARSAAAAEQPAGNIDNLRLSGWLQTAVNVSPFGPLERSRGNESEESSSSASSRNGGGGVGSNNNAAPPSNKRGPSLQWPLQRSSSVYSGDTQQQQQLSRSASRKRGTQTKWPLQDRSSTATEAIGVAVGDTNANNESGGVDQAVVRDNPATRNVVPVPPHRGIGLPGVARKVSFG